jgi:hypothetical protein
MSSTHMVRTDTRTRAQEALLSSHTAPTHLLHRMRQTELAIEVQMMSAVER